MYELVSEQEGKVVGITARGKLSGADLKKVIAYLEEQIEKHGKIRMLFEMDDFKGWEAEALFRDLKFDIEHNLDVERVAVVGSEAWEKRLSELMDTFSAAEVQYYDEAHLAEAWSWVRGKV